LREPGSDELEEDLLIEEATNTAPKQTGREATESGAQLETKEPSSAMWKVKLHLFATLVFTLVAYVIPLSFTSYLFTSEAK